MGPWEPSLDSLGITPVGKATVPCATEPQWRVQGFEMDVGLRQHQPQVVLPFVPCLWGGTAS